MIKRIGAVILSCLLLLPLCGCDKDEKAVAVDIDLTAMSGTMVYAEVYNMVNTPEQYLGKSVRIKGEFNAGYYEGTESYYYYVLIADATACCQQGIEFVWTGSHDYPEDYPENGAEIEIEGVFSTYTELDVKYYCINTDDVIVLK